MNLHLLQLGDSALPIGGYSHSWGLEAAIDRGLVRDPVTLENWVHNWLRHVVGPLEGVVVAVTSQAAESANWGSVVEANELLDASLSPPTLRNASREMGQQLLSLAESWPWAAECVAQLCETTVPSPDQREWHHAVVFGTLAAMGGMFSRPKPGSRGADLGVPAAKAWHTTAPEAVAVYFHQAALGVVSAGVRGIPIGHTHGQQIIARLHDDIEALATELAEKELETAGSFCPAYETLCHAQTQLYTRLFRS